MNLFDYLRSEEQTRVGEERKNLAGKANKIAKMVVRILTLEGLQPMVAEATTS